MAVPDGWGRVGEGVVVWEDAKTKSVLFSDSAVNRVCVSQIIYVWGEISI